MATLSLTGYWQVPPLAPVQVPKHSSTKLHRTEHISVLKHHHQTLNYRKLRPLSPPMDPRVLRHSNATPPSRLPATGWPRRGQFSHRGGILLWAMSWGRAQPPPPPTLAAPPPPPPRGSLCTRGPRHPNPGQRPNPSSPDPGYCQRPRATFIPLNSRLTHNAPLLPPPKAPPTSFRGQRWRETARGRGGKELTPRTKGAVFLRPAPRGSHPSPFLRVVPRMRCCHSLESRRATLIFLSRQQMETPEIVKPSLFPHVDWSADFINASVLLRKGPFLCCHSSRAWSPFLGQIWRPDRIWVWMGIWKVLSAVD